VWLAPPVVEPAVVPLVVPEVEPVVPPPMLTALAPMSTPPNLQSTEIPALKLEPETVTTVAPY